MKYLILIFIIYGIYKFAEAQKALKAKNMDQINKQEDDEGFVDYEEVE
jgi:hypothetical protein